MTYNVFGGTLNPTLHSTNYISEDKSNGLWTAVYLNITCIHTQYCTTLLVQDFLTVY